MNGNYLTKIMRLQAEGKAPRIGLYHATVAHEDWCAGLKTPPSECNCDPDIRFVDAHGKPWERERP